jgi:hypothetical protein
MTSFKRDGSRVTVNARLTEVTRDQALAALRTELASEPCYELIISECQRYKAPWHQSVEAWYCELGGVRQPSRPLD